MTPDTLARLDALHPELRALARDCDDVHNALTRHVRDGAPLDAVLWWAHERPRLHPVGRPQPTDCPPCPWATMPDGDVAERAAYLRALLDGARALDRGRRAQPMDAWLLWRP